MAGRKSKVLFDSIDLKILETLSETYDGIGVLDLAKKMNLTHQNLKKHLEKLLKARLIMTIKTTASTDKTQVGKIKLHTVLSGIMESYIDEFPEEAKNLIKEREEFSATIKILKKISGLDYEKETLREIINELAKSKIKKKS